MKPAGITFSMLRYVETFVLHGESPLAYCPSAQLPARGEDILEHLVLVDDLDAMFVGTFVDIVADAGKVGVHHERGGRVVFDVAGTALAIHFEGIVGHDCLVYSPAESCTWCGKNNGVVRGESWPLMSQADRFWSVDAHSPLHPGPDPRLAQAVVAAVQMTVACIMPSVCIQALRHSFLLPLSRAVAPRTAI